MLAIMQESFFTALRQTLSQERLEVYGSDGAASATVAARYLLNMALCESLYSPLQLCEVALRNSIHRELTSFAGTESWYDSTKLRLTPWAVEEVERVKAKIGRLKKPIIPGRVIAELQFGFWTSIFESHYEEIARFLPHGIKGVFRNMPKQLHNRHRIKRRLEQIRNLRNRVFHHERIIHWKDLEQQHEGILEVIAWISPELFEMAKTLDRFLVVRKAGIKPWKNKLLSHWPENASQETSSRNQKATIHAIPAPFDATNGAETPFGHRWGGDILEITAEHLMSLQSGETLLLDIQSEYVAFLKKSDDLHDNLKGLGYGC